MIDPGASVGSELRYLPGYTGEVQWGPLGWLLIRMLLALFLLASALARFDRASLAIWDVAIRLALAFLVLTKDPFVYGAAIVVAAAWLALHFARHRHTETGAEHGA